MTLNDLIRKASEVARQFASSDVDLMFIDAIAADSHGRQIKDIVFDPYTENGQYKIAVTFEDMKEQKPLRWSEKDEKNLKSVVSTLWFALNTPHFPLNYDRIIELETWLKSLRPQPKQVWSKEGKRKLNRIYEILGQAADEKPFGSSKRIIGDKEAVELQDFIKSLRPSWKPSEQEKGALKTAISVLTEERSFPKAAANLQTILDAFDGKETRKEWKPSEEQMEAFSSYIKDFQEKAEAAVGGWNNFDVMIRLYEQLKKL